MMVPTEDDYLKIYENAVLELETAPNDRNLQYRAVLALARMGSPDFALSEYERYDLSNLRHHEDIMALGGRLSKDLYLTTCLLYTSPSPRDQRGSRMPSSA